MFYTERANTWGERCQLVQASYTVTMVSIQFSVVLFEQIVLPLVLLFIGWSAGGRG